MFLKLYNADCFDVLPSIECADMVLIDPPYGCTYNEWDVPIDWKRLFTELKRITNLIVTFSDIRTAAAMIAAEPKWFRYEWIYEKTNATGFLNANRMPLRAHENVLVFYGRLPSYYPQWVMGKSYRRGCRSHSSNYNEFEAKGKRQYGDKRFPRDVLTFANSANQTGKLHPTEKPLAILEYLIKTYTKSGDTILDCFMGSGSTGLAAMGLGRDFIGIEKDEGYFHAAKNRLKVFA